MIRLKIGDVLVEQGIITKEQLEKALAIQKQTGGILGEILIKNSFATDEQITKALSRQFGLPFASRTNGLLVLSEKDSLRALLPEDFARTHHLTPLFIRDETLGVAVSDPMDVVTMDNLQILTGKNLMVYLAMKPEIAQMLDSLYGRSGATTEELSEMAKEAAVKSESTVPVEMVEEKADLDKVVAEAGQTQVVQLVNQIIRQAIEERASDIHIEPFEDIVSLRFRVDGVLHEKPPPAKVLAPPIISRIKILSKLNVAERRLPQDGSFVVKHREQMVDLRVSTVPTVFGEKLVVRILSKQAVELSIAKLGMEPEQERDFLKAASYPYGLILLTGPTGSGKTTTLYAILKSIQSAEVNIMTIEDPVEFQISGVNQVQVKPQIGLTFAAALRAFLRQDPDVILVGEVRDLETAELCTRAAMTGHLVLSTLHTNDALSAIPRLRDLGVEPFLISSTLSLVGAQRLLRVLCTRCREAYKPDRSHLEGLGFVYSEPFYRAKGCKTCFGTGYVGRKAIFEVILLNEKIRPAIHQNVSVYDLKKLAGESGSLSMKDAGYLKVQRGETSLEEYLSVVLMEV
ncbi:MAG: Flp pilus assembly complex ATPase component TadA [Elusimicrobia bacterium]|nr:Flp pilus assembly complex ATPase component TadA [Elusimicrobiota bacterium]